MSSISLLVPTHREDRPLARCLNSAAGQLAPGDEVIVCGDTHDGALPGVEALVQSYGRQFRYEALDAGHHCYGHCQVNYGLSLAEGDYIHLNDDDDVWTPNALSLMRQGFERWPKTPLLFRFKSYFGTIYWERVGLFERDRIGAHCLVAPRDSKLGRFECQYNGDFDYVARTIYAYGGPERAVWLDDLVAIARP